MSKSELINIIAETSKLTKADSDRALDAFTSAITGSPKTAVN